MKVKHPSSYPEYSVNPIYKPAFYSQKSANASPVSGSAFQSSVDAPQLSRQAFQSSGRCPYVSRVAFQSSGWSSEKVRAVLQRSGGVAGVSERGWQRFGEDYSVISGKGWWLRACLPGGCFSPTGTKSAAQVSLSGAGVILPLTRHWRYNILINVRHEL